MSVIRTSFVIRSSTQGASTTAEIFIILQLLFYMELLCCLHVRTSEAFGNEFNKYEDVLERTRK